MAVSAAPRPVENGLTTLARPTRTLLTHRASDARSESNTGLTTAALPILRCRRHGRQSLWLGLRVARTLSKSGFSWLFIGATSAMASFWAWAMGVFIFVVCTISNSVAVWDLLESGATRPFQPRQWTAPSYERCYAIVSRTSDLRAVAGRSAGRFCERIATPRPTYQSHRTSIRVQTSRYCIQRSDVVA